jgi:hypothetical protein
LVVDICEQLMAGDHPARVAAEFGVTESTVYQLRRGQIWTHIVTPEKAAAMMAIRQNAWADRKVIQQMRDSSAAIGAGQQRQDTDRRRTS